MLALNTAAAAAISPARRRDVARSSNVKIDAHATASGWTAADRDAMIAEEFARIETDGIVDWNGYKRARRVGSRFLLSRAVRQAVFALYTLTKLPPVAPAVTRAMTDRLATAMIENDTAELVDLNDYAVNCLREGGYPDTDALRTLARMTREALR